MKTIPRLLALFIAAYAMATAAPEPPVINGYVTMNPIESELFQPEFLFAQREALGLGETQLQDIQALMRDAQTKFENLVPQRGGREVALHGTLREAKPDVAQVEEKLRALLAVENEMKVVQVRLLMSLRNKLTPEQVVKARELRLQVRPGSNPAEGLPQRLQAKFEKLRAVIEARAAGGQPPVELVEKAQEIQQLVQNNNPLEAERQLDALLATLPELKPKP